MDALAVRAQARQAGHRLDHEHTLGALQRGVVAHELVAEDQCGVAAQQPSGPQAGPATQGQFVGLYHVAWEVPSMEDLLEARRKLAEAGALVGMSDHGANKSLYAKDPDGIEFEVAWVVPAALLDDEVRSGRSGVKPLDLEREKARYGAETKGGIGISIPVGA